MAFNMTTSGAGWRLCNSLITFGHEVAAAYPALTCLGTVGDAAHQSEGTASDHNPFVKDPHTGVGIVRAIDIGGPDDQLKALRQKLWVMYADSDSRLFEFGYAKGCSDNLINNWGLPFATHVDDGDAGHLHLSVTRVGAAGYAPAIDSTASWGIGGATFSGGGTQIVGDDVDPKDVWNFVVPVPQLGAGVADTAADLLATLRGLVGDIDNKADQLIKAQTSIDYTALAKALISELKAA